MDLKSKIEEAKTKLGLSNQELSIKLGHQKRYITNALLDPSVKRQKEIILKIEALMLKESGELTHDFEGKALNKFIDDAVMVSKAEYDGLNKSINGLNSVNADLFNANSVKDFQINQLKKELDHKNQVLDKRNDLYSSLELQLKDKDEEIKKIEHNYDALLDSNKNLNEKMLLAEQDSEKWQGDYWTVSRENIGLINSKRAISIWLAISVLIIVLMIACAVLRFHGVV